MMSAVRGPAQTRKTAGGGVGRRRKGASKPLIANNERQRLIEACAFFHANYYRCVEPGSYRAQDLKDAAAEIDAILKRRARTGGQA